jgi:hypothetical protein
LLCIEQPLAPTLGSFTVPGILFDVGDQTRVADHLSIACGIKATIEVEVGASQVHSNLLGHLLQGVQTLGKEHHIRFIDGSHRDRR